MTLLELKNSIKKMPLLQRALAKIFSSPHVCRWVHPWMVRWQLSDFARSETARKRRQFFEQHTAEVAQVLALLADEKSKQVFRNQICYRSGGPVFPVGTPRDQYFPDFIHLGQEEVFVDCGAFSGDSILQFKQVCQGQYKKIVAFEPTPMWFDHLLQQSFDKCICLKQGVWSQQDTLTFLSNGRSDDRVKQFDFSGRLSRKKTEMSISVDAIDHIPACADMTYLKMDIEGAEQHALKGARKTILKQRPVLAISIYHSDEDLLQIPLWIAGLQLPYKHYVRLHSWPDLDVVWYAVPA